MQVQSDFRAMKAEFEKRQVEWVEKVHINKEATRAEQQWSKESDAKWMAFMQWLQDGQGQCQKEADDDHVHRAAEIEKQRMQQQEWHIEAQWRLHVSQGGAQSSALYQCHGYPSVQVHMPPLPQQLLPAPPPHVQVCIPPPLSQLNGPQFVPPPPHPLIPVNALLQVPVLDFVQQCMIAQIPLTRQENEGNRLEQDLHNSISDLEEAVQLSQLLRAAVQEQGRL